MGVCRQFLNCEKRMINGRLERCVRCSHSTVDVTGGRLRRRKHLNWPWEEVFRRKTRGQRLRRKDIQAEIYEKHTRPGNCECVPWDLTGNHSLGRPGKARETTSAHCTLLARQCWQGESKCRPFSEGSGETLWFTISGCREGVLICPLGWKKMDKHCCFPEHQGCLTTQDLELAGCQTHSLQLLSSRVWNCADTVGGRQAKR